MAKSKKRLKIVLTYVITIVCTLTIVGGMGLYLINEVLFGEKKEESDGVYMDKLVTESEYVPNNADKQTVLIILDLEKRQTASCFMLVRFLPVEQKLTILPLPSNTYAKLNSEENSIYEFYRTQGIPGAIQAVEACTGLKIDKHMKFNRESFENIVDIFGGVEFSVPYNLIYSNTDTGEETVIKEGETYLDNILLRKVLTFPNYKSGEEYRSKCLGVTTSEMLNQNISAAFADHLDDYFEAVINSDIETDITAYDYGEKSEAMKYVIKNSEYLSQAVISTGTYNENNLYVLDENFIRSLNEWFKLYDE